MQKQIYLTMGYPGSGKTTYLHNYLAFEPHTIICPDQIREELTGDAGDQSQNDRVFNIFFSRLKEALKSDKEEHQIIGIDATFLRREYRKPVFKAVAENCDNYQIIILEIGLSPEESKQRQLSRERQVPDYVFERMQQKHNPLSDEEIKKYNIKRIQISKDTPLFKQGETAFIGDIQSCYKELEKLLYQLGFYIEGGQWQNTGACKEVVFLGDLTDRGPDSVNTLKTVMQLYEKGWARCVRGNHDDKLARYLKGNPVRAAHGLELTIQHLSILTEDEKKEIFKFLDALPSSIQFDIHGKKYTAAHAWWQEWMLDKTEKSIKERNMYGVIGTATTPKGTPSRVRWWELEEYSSKDYVVIFGHYAEKIDLPHAKCVDTGACFGQELTAFIPTKDKEIWISVTSNWDWNKEFVMESDDVNVLAYKELFAKLKSSPQDIIKDIEADPDLIKRRYNIEHNGETFELTIANAAKSLYTPCTNSYAQQIAKGIVYNRDTGEIVSVSLPKFYNYGEKEVVNDTLHDYIKSGKYKLQFVEKLDGTQIARFVYKGKVFWNTRSVIISEPNEGLLDGSSIDFYKLTMDAVQKSNRMHYLDPLVHNDKTLIFELLHPENATIVPFEGAPQLSLLSYTVKDSKTGLWMDQRTVFETMDDFELPVVYKSSGSLEEAQELLNQIEHRDGISEGFVANVIDDNGKVYFRIKFKTPKFFEAMRLAHHCTYDRVVEVCTEHKINNKQGFIAYLKKDKDTFPEELLEKYNILYDQYQEYCDLRNDYQEKIKKYFDIVVRPMVEENATRKEIALSIKDYCFCSHLFALLDDKPVDDETLNKFFKFEKEQVLSKLKVLDNALLVTK